MMNSPEPDPRDADYYPLLPNIYADVVWIQDEPKLLKRYKGSGYQPGQRFAERFLVAWERLPEAARQRLLTYWRYRGRWYDPSIELIGDKLAGRQGTCTDDGYTLRFPPSFDFPDAPDQECTEAIARVLDQAYCHATGDQSPGK